MRRALLLSVSVQYDKKSSSGLILTLFFVPQKKSVRIWI